MQLLEMERKQKQQLEEEQRKRRAHYDQLLNARIDTMADETKEAKCLLERQIESLKQLRDQRGSLERAMTELSAEIVEVHKLKMDELKVKRHTRKCIPQRKPQRAKLESKN